jgi:hypothetical protein
MGVDEFVDGLDLSPPQRKKEEELRVELRRAWERHEICRLELGRILSELKKTLAREKHFKRYLELARIPRSTAYRLVVEWERVKELRLPEPVLREAERRNLKLFTEEGRTAIKKIRPPKNKKMTENQTQTCVQKIAAEVAQLRLQSRNAAPRKAQTPEGRYALILQRATEGFQKLDRNVIRLYEALPDEERKEELLTTLFSHLAGKAGITKTLTIKPAPPSMELSLPIERLEARRNKQSEKKVA